MIAVHPTPAAELQKLSMPARIVRVLAESSGPLSVARLIVLTTGGELMNYGRVNRVILKLRKEGVVYRVKKQGCKHEIGRSVFWDLCALKGLRGGK